MPGLDTRGDGGYVIVWEAPIGEVATITLRFESPPAQRQIGPGIGEGSRDESLFKYASWCVSQEKTEAEVLQLVKDRNATYVPPLDEQTVLDKVRSAEKYRKVPEKMVDFASDHARKVKGRKPPVVRFLWEPRIVRGGIVTFDGPEGVGKSTMCMHIAEMESQAGGNVLFLQYEDESGFLRRYGAINEGTGFISDWGGELPKFPADMERLTKLCDKERISLVVIDALSNAISGIDYNRVQEMKENFLDPLERYCTASGMVVILLRHVNKNSDMAPGARADGSQAPQQKARSSYLFLPFPGEANTFAMLCTKSRDVELPPTLKARTTKRPEDLAAHVEVLGTTLMGYADLMSEMKRARSGRPCVLHHKNRCDVCR